MRYPSGRFLYRDLPFWGAVRELYLKDLVVEALEEAEKLGGRDSNDIFAEAEVRRLGEPKDLFDWLTVEVIPEEAGPRLEQAYEIIASECQLLSSQFGWDNREATVVAFLPKAVEAEWMPGRFGYFVDKEPYDKICLPNYLLHDLPQLRKAIRHEFTHAITVNLANGHDPRWFKEAFATLMEGRVNSKSWWRFRDEPSLWADPVGLDSRVSTDLRDESRSDFVTLGYDQCSFIARYLYEHGGFEKLKQLLDSIGDESLLPNLESHILGRTRADRAVRHTYGFSEHELFERALKWIRETPVPAPSF